MDKAQLALENANSVAGNAAVAVDIARAALNKTQVAVDKANNDMDIAKNNLNIARTNLDNAVVTAPFDGIIANVNVKEGDVLSQVNYTTAIVAQIIAPSRMELDIVVKEMDIPSVKLGQKVTVSVDALPDERFEGVVTSVSPLPLTASNLVSYEVKTVFSVPQNSALKAGMGATADIIIDKRSNVLLVPSRAVKKDSQGKPIVGVLVSGQTQDRAVTLGLSDGPQTEVVNGLDEGQTIVVSKTISLYDGPKSKS